MPVKVPLRKDADQLCRHEKQLKLETTVIKQSNDSSDTTIVDEVCRSHRDGTTMYLIVEKMQDDNSITASADNPRSTGRLERSTSHR